MKKFEKLTPAVQSHEVVIGVGRKFDGISGFFTWQDYRSKENAGIGDVVREWDPVKMRFSFFLRVE